MVMVTPRPMVEGNIFMEPLIGDLVGGGMTLQLPAKVNPTRSARPLSDLFWQFRQ